MKKLLSLLLFLCASCCSVVAQDFISLSGRVVALKGRALPQVNVVDRASSAATVTNGDGNFLLKVPIQSGRDSIDFSYVGYTNQAVAVGDLLVANGGMVVELPRELFVLDDVDVAITSASAFMDDVFYRRNRNCEAKRMAKTVFYREMVKKRNSFATLTEAVVDVDKAGYNSLLHDRAAIYKGRSLRDHRFTDTLFVKLQGGIVSALKLDLVKDDGMVFTNKPSDDYNFWFQKPTTIDGRKMYVVSFNQKSSDPEDMLFRGYLYIDSMTRAVARAELNLNVEERKKAAASLIRKQPRGADIAVTSAEFVVSYRNIGDKWHFDYCNSALNLRCHIGRRLFRNNYTIASEMVVTQHNAKERKINPADRLRSDDLIYESVQAFYDEDFWENYNVIEHELGINAIVKRFKRQLDHDK